MTGTTTRSRAPRSADVIDVLRWLITQDTTTGTGGEREGLRRFAAYAADRAGATGTMRVDPDGDACVLLPPADCRPVLLFACHIDTVPTGDPAQWRRAPRSGDVDDGCVWGRGASDMKSGLAAALGAVVNALRDGHPVALAVTTGEEAGCRGADACAALLSDVLVGAVIIPESTDNLVALGHRGAAWFTVATRGVAAHGSTPEAGVNAALALARVVIDLDSLPLRRHPSLGAESVNVGVLRGGEVHNIVPDLAEAAIDHRIIDADITDLRDWWSARVDQVEEDLRLDPVWTAADHPWVSGLPAPAAPGPVAYFTDASVLVRYLPPGTPIVVWGPGDPAVVHRANERVSVAAVETAASLFAAAATAWSP